MKVGLGPIYCEMGPDPECGRIKFVKDKIILKGFQFSSRSGGECSRSKVGNGPG